MFGNFGRPAMVVAVTALCCTASASAQPVAFPGIYTQNFDSMTPTGTAAPAGWQHYQVGVGAGNGVWTNSTGTNTTAAVGAIPNGTSVAAGTATTGLVANDNPTGNQNQGYNATGSTGLAADRAISTAPTGNAGSAIELQLTNSLGIPIPALNVSYDIRRYQIGSGTTAPPAGIPAGSDELPGYWLFYSLDGGVNYTAVDSLIPVGDSPSSPPGQPIVPNTVGLTNVTNARFNFIGGSWTPGSSLFLRWVDDNGIASSPDTILGLDNVSISPVPEPSSLICLSAVTVLAGMRVVRKRFRRTVA